MTIARVALDVPVDTLFDYAAPDVGPQDIGQRVLVPFGRKKLVGVIMEVAQTSDVPPDRLKPAHRILHDAPPLPPPVLRLLKFCAAYYHHPLGEVVLNALPTRLREEAPARAPAPLAYGLTDLGWQVEVDSLPKRAALQRRVLATLRSADRIGAEQLRELGASVTQILSAFQERGWVHTANPATRVMEAQPAPALNAEQQAVVDAFRAQGEGFRTWLLHGITGSGKTEVYLHLMQEVLERGGQALVLVPEINLTPQLEAHFRRRFPDRTLVSLHSGLSSGERLANWLKAHEGTADIVLGTRLAVFAPVPRLALIVVDEEHDASYKQQEGLRYCARDVAVMRAKQEGIPVVLGSATPALETYHNAALGRFQLARLSRRAVPEAALPAIACVDSRACRPREGLTPPLVEAMRARLARGEQSLVFINRRGFAPVLLCGGCGWSSTCDRCSARMVVHLRERRLRCHHCGKDTPVPRSCPSCGNVDLLPVGHGTQRAEQAVQAVFPEARVLRIDRDAVRRKNAAETLLGQVHAGEVDIIVGTQMLAKGHDFKRLTLVGVVDADSALYSADYRAAERLFAQLMQVAGRAGRSGRPGEVLIQTAFPAHPLFECLRRHDFDAFARSQLEDRRTCGFPPFRYEALLRAEARDMATVLEFLDQARRHAPEDDRIDLFDAVPSPMTRLAGKERAHVLVQSESRPLLQAFLGEWVAHLRNSAPSRVRWTLDVDPLEF